MGGILAHCLTFQFKKRRVVAELPYPNHSALPHGYKEQLLTSALPREGIETLIPQRQILAAWQRDLFEHKRVMDKSHACHLKRSQMSMWTRKDRSIEPHGVDHALKDEEIAVLQLNGDEYKKFYFSGKQIFCTRRGKNTAVGQSSFCNKALNAADPCIQYKAPRRV